MIVARARHRRSIAQARTRRSSAPKARKQARPQEAQEAASRQRRQQLGARREAGLLGVRRAGYGGIWRDMAGYGGIWRDMAGYGQIWRDTSRYRKEIGQPRPGDAPPPSDSLQGGAWGSASSGDGEAEYADLGLRNPDWLVESGPGGTTEHNYPLGCEAATGTAASAVDSQLPEAQRSAPSHTYRA